MKINLYDDFQHWLDGGTIFLYSDPHFEGLDCTLMNPSWPSPDEQVKAINSVVGKNDTLIILGDIGNPEYIKQLKGHKVLITGNHDKGSTTYKAKYWISVRYKDGNIVDFKDEILNGSDLPAGDIEDIRHMSDKLFDEVYSGPLFINNKILLSHEPIVLPFGINIHGHCHGKEHSFYQADTWARVNVCSDVIGWKPVRLDKVLDKFKVTDLHRVTIDDATDRICPIKDPNCLRMVRCKHE